MVDPDNYIITGDEIIAVPRSMSGTPVEGRVLAIVGKAIGRREFIVEEAGSHWLTQGAMGLPENLYVFAVCRGDGWVKLPLYLLPEEAAAKIKRSFENSRKRIQSKVPLFADQIEVVVPSPQEMMERFNGQRQQDLQHDHDLAIRANGLREQVEALISAEQFAGLCTRRSRYPRDPLYGIGFWKEQLQHIQETGQPYVVVVQPPVNQRLNIPWLKPDAHVKWASPNGPKTVRVLFIGTQEVMIKTLGEPITDFDPRQHPYGNTWVGPDALTPLP